MPVPAVTALTRYLDDGTLEISNNAAERAIRRPAQTKVRNILDTTSRTNGLPAQIAEAISPSFNALAGGGEALFGIAASTPHRSIRNGANSGMAVPLASRGAGRRREWRAGVIARLRGENIELR
jgi:hypothetical protein